MTHSTYISSAPAQLDLLNSLVKTSCYISYQLLDYPILIQFGNNFYRCSIVERQWLRIQGGVESLSLSVRRHLYAIIIIILMVTRLQENID